MKVEVLSRSNRFPDKISKEIKFKSFHEAIGQFLAFSQYFALLPVLNVLQPDENKLKFSWNSRRTIYAISWLVFATIEGSVAVRRLFRLGFDVHYVEVLMFFLLSPARAVICFNLARHWKSIMQYWKKCEEGFLKYPFEEKGLKLERKAKIVLIVLILQTFGENNFSNFKGLNKFQEVQALITRSS